MSLALIRTIAIRADDRLLTAVSDVRPVVRPTNGSLSIDVVMSDVVMSDVVMSDVMIDVVIDVVSDAIRSDLRPSANGRFIRAR